MRRTVSGITLMMLVVSMLTLARGYDVNSAFAPSASIRMLRDVVECGIGVYWDFNCTDPIAHIEWGTLKPGEGRGITVYVRNEGDENTTLYMTTQNWSPPYVAPWVHLDSDYLDEVLEPSQIVNVTLSLSVDPDVEEISVFGFEISISYTCGGIISGLSIAANGSILYIRRVLFDMLHVEQFRFYHDYSRLSDELSARGYIMYQIGREQWDDGQLTYDMLENFNILVLPNPQIVRFAPSEVQAIIDFVRNGGGLLVLGGSYPVSDVDYPVKDIITHFGIEYKLPIAELMDFVIDMSLHPVTRNVTNLYMPFVEALNITIPAQGIAFSQGKPTIAVTGCGSGRVVVIAAEHMFADPVIGMCDNLLLGLNAFEWLSEFGGGPYPQELPLIEMASWNPPTSMFVDTDYAVNVEIQNFGNDSITVVVTMPNVPIFNKTGWGVGELIGDSRSINVFPEATKNSSLTIRAPICGYTYLETYVYAPFNSAYLVFDGEYTNEIQISTQPPVADFAWNPTMPKVDELVTFNASASTPNGGEIISYEWDFGDGEYATGRIVTHTFSNQEIYMVTLNITDNEGLWDVEQKQIQVVQPYGPKAEFTWIPSIPEVGDFAIPIFDASASTSGWNGTHEMPITEYRWDFGDGNKIIRPIPTVQHIFGSLGNYYVTLTVYAPGATPGTDSITHNVTVTSAPVGGYSFPIEGYPTIKPLTLYLALMGILTASFTIAKRRKKQQS